MSNNAIVALKDSWKTQHMPADKNKRIDTDIPLKEEDLRTLAMGHIPKDMGDHWFMYFDGEYLRWYRSWTGTCIYKARVARERGRLYIPYVIANRDPEQYGCTSDEEDMEQLRELIAMELMERR